MTLADTIEASVRRYFGGRTDNPDDPRLLAEHLIADLGLVEHFAPAVRLHDGYIDPDTQWEGEWDVAAGRAKIFGERIATRIVSRWTWARNQVGHWLGPDDWADHIAGNDKR